MVDASVETVGASAFFDVPTIHFSYEGNNHHVNQLLQVISIYFYCVKEDLTDSRLLT